MRNREREKGEKKTDGQSERGGKGEKEGRGGRCIIATWLPIISWFTTSSVTHTPLTLSPLPLSLSPFPSPPPFLLPTASPFFSLLASPINRLPYFFPVTMLLFYFLVIFFLFFSFRSLFHFLLSLSLLPCCGFIFFFMS